MVWIRWYSSWLPVTATFRYNLLHTRIVSSWYWSSVWTGSVLSRRVPKIITHASYCSAVHFSQGCERQCLFEFLHPKKASFLANSTANIHHEFTYTYRHMAICVCEFGVLLPCENFFAYTGQWHGCSSPGPSTPDQSVYHARTQVWKTPLFRGFWTKKQHPFFNRNRWFWGPVKHPFLNKTRFFFHNLS